ncbi:MAG: ethanolamine ammonia-lyase subunit EutB, partial [Planctomycetota bacterium]
MSRRRFVAGLAAAPAIAMSRAAAAEEDLIAHVTRGAGGWNQSLFTRLLGHANAFKEGDEIVGVAPPDEAARRLARSLLGRTRLRDIDSHPPFSDTLSAALAADLDADAHERTAGWTLDDPATFLLTRPEGDIRAIMPGLSSDVVLGTNMVSSEPASVRLVSDTLREVLEAFGLGATMPHCVLAHVDVQAEVDATAPGTTGVWFQSIAGSDAANATFDVSLAKMLRHAAGRRGPWGLYFETGQGADFTNGHAQGVDMVIHESRKYGFARLLAHAVADARGGDPWV